MTGKTALLFGATGLIGGHLLDLLLQDPRYRRVDVFTRRPLGLTHERLHQHLIDFSRLENYQQLIRGDELFCCLGTTMKKAGSRAAFREVDYHYPMQLAEMGSHQGLSRYLVVSSAGANPRSGVFYTRVKGEMERGVQLYPFEQIAILRPSLLLDERPEKRAWEDVGKSINALLQPLLVGSLKRYKGIYALDVARAMIQLANEPQSEVIFESEILFQLSQAYPITVEG